MDGMHLHIGPWFTSHDTLTFSGSHGGADGGFRLSDAGRNRARCEPCLVALS